MSSFVVSSRFGDRQSHYGCEFPSIYFTAFAGPWPSPFASLLHRLNRIRASGLTRPIPYSPMHLLGAWSESSGICTVGSIAEVERLGSLLSQIPVDLQAACGKAGVVLEAILDFLTLTYQCKVLRKPGDKLSAIFPARNVFGAHFNRLYMELPETDAVRFSKLVHEFAVILIDGDAGWPRSDKSGSYWATVGEMRRLHPLKEPS